MRGRAAMARATATRRRWPPESSAGLRLMYSDKPVTASISSTRARISWRGIRPSSVNLKPTFCSTVSESKSAPSWKSMPMESRTAIMRDSDSSSMRSPLMRITPESGRMSPSINLSTRDFPAPLGPIRIAMWPSAIVKLTSRSTTASSKASATCSKATAGVSVTMPACVPRASRGGGGAPTG